MSPSPIIVSKGGWDDSLKRGHYISPDLQVKASDICAYLKIQSLDWLTSSVYSRPENVKLDKSEAKEIISRSLAYIALVCIPVVVVCTVMLIVLPYISEKKYSLLYLLDFIGFIILVVSSNIGSWLDESRSLTADELAFVDRRPPIVFVRSFVEDGRFQVDGNLRTIWNNASPFLSLFVDIPEKKELSIEEVVGNLSRGLGPFISIASKRQKGSLEGSAREDVADNIWQAKIDEWFNAALLIVAVPGETEGIRWELDRIKIEENRSKVIVILPNESWREKLARLQSIKDLIGWELEFEGDRHLFKNLIALYASEAGFVPVVSHPVLSLNRDDFAVGVATALYAKLNL